MIKEITSDEFKNLVLESNEPVFVDFYADWCGPCKMLGPIMNEIANENKVYKINVDNCSELSHEYGIMSIPCVILFNEGKEVNRSIGLKSKNDILEMLK